MKTIAVLAAIVVASLAPAGVFAQNAAPPPAQALIGNWQGALVLGPNTMRIGLVVTPGVSGGYSATLIAIDQDGASLSVTQVSLAGSALHLDLAAIRGSYDGMLAPGGQDITGTFTQGMPLPLNFRRVDKLDPPPVFSEADKADVRAVVDKYFASFTRRDYDALRSVFQTPWTLWPLGGQPTVLMNVEEVVTRSKTTREGLEGTTYGVSRVERMTITPLSSSTALADVHWRRDKKDGSLFGEGAEILTVVKTPAGWRINGNMPRALSHYGKVF